VLRLACGLPLWPSPDDRWLMPRNPVHGMICAEAGITTAWSSKTMTTYLRGAMQVFEISPRQERRTAEFVNASQLPVHNGTADVSPGQRPASDASRHICRETDTSRQ